MTRSHWNSERSGIGRALGASLGIAALAATVGCSARDGVAAAPQTASTLAGVPQPNGAPILVSCEPHQRTLVRPVVVNGAQISQVECVAAADAPLPTATSSYVAAPAPTEYRTVRTIAPAPVYDDARVVTTERPVTTARAIPTRQVVYRDEVPVRKKRTVAKSAVIIGSTAGAGAGVGALIGGKKGALIGAAVGGGGATLWDQITRRKD